MIQYMIVDIFECINEEYMSYITIYNNIIICLEDDTDYNYSNLIFTYVLKSRLLYSIIIFIFINIIYIIIIVKLILYKNIYSIILYIIYF